MDASRISVCFSFCKDKVNTTPYSIASLFSRAICAGLSRLHQHIFRKRATMHLSMWQSCISRRQVILSNHRHLPYRHDDSAPAMCFGDDVAGVDGGGADDGGSYSLSIQSLVLVAHCRV